MSETVSEFREKFPTYPIFGRRTDVTPAEAFSAGEALGNQMKAAQESKTQRVFDVTLSIRGRVPADNAGDAIAKLSQSVRDGIGPDEGHVRAYGAEIQGAGASEWSNTPL